MLKDYIPISLGLSEFTAPDCKASELAIIAIVISRSSYKTCLQCSKSTNRIRQYQKRAIEDVPLRNKLWLKIKQRRYRYSVRGKVFTETFESIRPKSHRTIRYKQYLFEKGKDPALERCC